MKVWIGCQYVGALLGCVAGFLIGITATTIFVQMLGAVVFGLSAVGLAVLSASLYAAELAEQQTAVLREIRDRLAIPAPQPAEIARPRPATLPPAEAVPAPAPTASPNDAGARKCSACMTWNPAHAQRCARCGVFFPPRN